jgi:FkbM family methyltransferase
MSLSVCLLTADPGPRIAALLSLFRPVASEIVVAADSRVDPATLAYYASASDQVHRIAVDHSEAHFAWLHARCSGDWIFRIDGDEVPSAGLLAALPELASRRDVSQYRVPRRWLHGDFDHWLSGLPWWPDYQIRMVRNDGTLRFPAIQHTAAVPLRPAEYLETPIYHGDLLLNSLEQRRAKAHAYRRRRPGLTAPGGGPINERFYLPEDSPHAPLADVPAPDRELVHRVLAAEPWAVDPSPLPEAEVVGFEVTKALNPDRVEEADACSAVIELIEEPPVMLAGETRELHARFTNTGTATWPWDAELGPPISASYHLLEAAGDTMVGEGPRTAFPRSTGPGSSTVVPVVVVAPPVPGRYVLDLDVVHEGVRWFGSGTRVALDVLPDPNRDEPIPEGQVARRLPEWARRVGEAAGVARHLATRDPAGLRAPGALGYVAGCEVRRTRQAEHPLLCRLETTDPVVFDQIFVEREYSPLDDLEGVGLVVDCGAYVGYSGAYFLSRFPGSRLVAVEPSPENCRLLRRNLAPYGERAEVVEAAVWSGPTRLAPAEEVFRDGQAWAFHVRPPAAEEEAAIPALGIADILRRSGEDSISLLKIDVEGAETAIFSEGLEGWIGHVETLVAELHDDAPNGAAVTAMVVAALRQHGFLAERSGELTIFRRSASGAVDQLSPGL